VEWTTASPRIDHYLLVVTLALIVSVPLGLRVVADVVPTKADDASYLPSLEASRPRQPFRRAPLDDLKTLKPTYVFIGDSMLGTRIDEVHLSVRMDYKTNARLFHPATGPAWWYLAFKNYLVASGEKPEMTFVFFRDYQLTDTMFRLGEQFRFSLDEVALDTEPTLDAIVAANVRGPYYRVHRTIDRLYEADRLHTWVEPRVLAAPAYLVTDDHPAEFPRQVNTLFELDRLRPFTAADIAQMDEAQADFETRLPLSILPPLVKLARANGLRLCFVRVKRRPGPDGVTTAQPEVLRRYIADLQHWLASQGQYFIDDTDDPQLTIDMYADGDHVNRDSRDRYTDMFLAKAQQLAR